MHPALSKYLSARLIDRANGHRALVLDRFMRVGQSDYFAQPLREERRRQALAELLNDARLNVPHSRTLLSGTEITPSNAGDVLRRLPAMRRADIQANPAAFTAENLTDVVDDFTGGSTGTPLTFKVDRPTQRAREASLMWANGLAGWKPGQRIAMLWGSDRDTKAAFRDWRLNLRWWIDNMRWYNAFDMGEAEMAAFHRAMSRFKPHLLVAYAGSLQVYARFLRQSGETVQYPLTSLVSSAEVLSAGAREEATDYFKKPVFDRYGNREAGAIAAECEAHNGLHVNEHDFVVEVDSPNPFQEPGPLLVTYLANRAMPLIRYDTGDLAIWAKSECSCGRTTRRLARIVGRQGDTIRTAGGKLIHGEFFTHVMYGADGVREFQFVQETLNRYCLRVVADEIRPEFESAWRAKIEPMLGSGAEFRVEKVDSIPVLSSGKRRFTLSLLDG